MRQALLSLMLLSLAAGGAQEAAARAAAPQASEQASEQDVQPREPAAQVRVPAAPRTALRPRPRPQIERIPAARWDFRSERERWGRAALKALRNHGAALVRETPADVASWCPGYASGDAIQRRAFWVGFLSALAKHESTWNPRAVGGGGLWYGLLQILPGTARGYGCAARSGAELTDGAANLSCAIRILAVTVPRDGVIAQSEPRWSGVAADWGPMRSPAKRQEMANWLRGQDYCQRRTSPRPMARPRPEALVLGPLQPQLRPKRKPQESAARAAQLESPQPYGPQPL